MKKVIICIALATSAFITIDDILTKTGTNETAVKRSILNAALLGSDEGILPQYNAEAADLATAYKVTKAIILNQRAGIVTEMGTYLKKYYNSPAFKKDFAEAAEAYKPGEAPKDSATLKAEYDASIKAMAAAYESMKKTYDKDKIKSQTNNSINSSQAAIEQVQKMLKEHPEMVAQSGMTQEELLKKMQQAQAQIAEGKQKANEEFDTNMTKEKMDTNLKEAEKNYNDDKAKLKAELDEKLKNLPADRKAYNEKVALYQKRSNYKLNIKSSLQHFLDATAGIDFDAAVSVRGNITYFNNPAYEKKSNFWKACFRAGKEANTAARTFAQQWIGELK